MRLFVVLALAACGSSGTATAPEPAPDPAVEPVVEPVPAEPAPAATASRCGDGGLKQIGHWQGEYPSPIAHVTKALSLPSYKTPCDATPTETCAVEAGVYHPWAQQGSEFVTLRQVERYTASAAFTVEGLQVAKGEVIEIPAYLSEGFCNWNVKGKELEAMCPGVDEYPLIEIETEKIEAVQLMKLPCGSWVQVDAAFMATDGIQDGEMIEYGKVGPAK